jgi:hypothetical protein
MSDPASLEQRVAELERRLAVIETHFAARNSDEGVPGLQANSLGQPNPPAYVSVSLASKRFHKADFTSGDSGDRIDLELLFGNKTDRAIRAFKSLVRFRDLFDHDILSVGLTYEDGIRPNATARWKGGIEFNQFQQSHGRLLSINQQDLKVSLTLHAVIFADGTVENFE